MSATTVEVAMRDAPTLTPREAVERYIDMRRIDATDKTVRAYENRLTRFLEWCDEEGIDRMEQVSAFDLDEYRRYLQASGRSPITQKGLLSSLRVFLRYCGEVGIVEDGLADAVNVPTIDPVDETSDDRLATEDAKRALEALRNDVAHVGTPIHATLEVFWHTGARLGGVRGLDLGDYDSAGRTLTFRHRPSTGTPLKNKRRGERMVGLSEAVADCLDTYIARERYDKRDDYGRSPLFATRQGRASDGSLRGWCYLATEPCLWMDCPHGNRRPTCEFVHRNHASQCPSSRSPHAVRTGHITWAINEGQPVEAIAERVNATPAVIRRYYDKPDTAEAFEERRKHIEHDLDILGGEG